MNIKMLTRLALLAAVLGMVAYGQGTAFAATPPGQEPPLRLSEPIDVVIADLERNIPAYMREEDIPGLAIALIRDGEVVWTQGFGVANAITRRPVTPETLFEVASNSKVVTAYIALRLVDQGILSLDEPLNAYLPEPWLPSSEYRDLVTLRHVLSHTSGLGASIVLNKDLRFAPGSNYYYSGIGYLYLQEVIEQVTGKPLEEVAREMVFEPLGMSSSSFVSDVTTAPRVANGHVNLALPILLFTCPSSIIFGVVGLIGLVVLRVWTGQWRPTRAMVVGACVVAAFLFLVLVFATIGETLLSLLPEFVSLTLTSTAGFALVFAVTLFVGRQLVTRLFASRVGENWLRVLNVLWAVVSFVVLLWLASSFTNVPVPNGPPPRPNTTGTLRTTASDLAILLTELAEPQHLGPEIKAQMRTPQVSLGRDLSWGLGFGIQHGEQGDALWQWGQHFDFQSVMIVYPEHGLGVVVCTNNDLFNPDVALEVAHRALGGQIEPIRRAIHLEFNYRGG